MCLGRFYCCRKTRVRSVIIHENARQRVLHSCWNHDSTGCAWLRSLREAEADATEEPDAVADEAATRVIKSPPKSLCLFFSAWGMIEKLFCDAREARRYCYWTGIFSRNFMVSCEDHYTVVCAGGIATNSTSSTFEQLAPLPGARFWRCCRSWSTSWGASCCRWDVSWLFLRRKFL